MKPRNWLIVNAAYYALLCAGYLIAPGRFLPLFYLPEVGGVAPYVARLGGSLGIALFILIWAIRGTRDLTVFRTAFAVLLFVDLVSLALTVAGVLSGVGPAGLWWMAAAIIAALTLVSAYFLLRPGPAEEWS